MSKRALVTAGSAVTMLDDVRSVQLNRLTSDINTETAGRSEFWHHEMQNIFRGALGIMIAQELVKQGIATTLLLRKDSIAGLPEADGLSVKSFKTFEQLEQGLESCLAEKPDLVFMSAAPPDYAPVKLQGKMRSDAEEITITYRRTPKLIDRLRQQLGDSAFLVGFKLLVGVPTTELCEVAARQIVRAKTDMCVGNDLARINPTTKRHPMDLVFSNGETLSLDGLKTDVAARLVNEVLKRSDAKNV